MSIRVCLGLLTVIPFLYLGWILYVLTHPLYPEGYTTLIMELAGYHTLIVALLWFGLKKRKNAAISYAVFTALLLWLDKNYELGMNLEQFMPVLLVCVLPFVVSLVVYLLKMPIHLLVGLTMGYWVIAGGTFFTQDGYRAWGAMLGGDTILAAQEGIWTILISGGLFFLGKLVLTISSWHDSRWSGYSGSSSYSDSSYSSHDVEDDSDNNGYKEERTTFWGRPEPRFWNDASQRLKDKYDLHDIDQDEFEYQALWGEKKDKN